MSAVAVDSHTLYWLATDSDELSDTANSHLDNADVRYVSAITWYELALLFERGRLDRHGRTTGDLLTMMEGFVITVPVDWRLALKAAELEHQPTFPRDPADRLIYATAQTRSVPLVTRDAKLLDFSKERCVW